MKNSRLAAIAAGVLISGAALAPRLEAQELLQRVKDLYASAAYEAALSAVSTVSDPDATPDIEQYRILCLVALGRTQPAERSIERLLMQHPLYHPVPGETPPRIQEQFTAVRRRLGPSIAEGLYRDGKAAYERRERAVAVRLFDELARLANDVDLRGEPVIAQMRILADGFLTLSEALPSNELTDLVSALPALSEPAVPGAAASRARVATAPIPIREALPTWTPQNELARRVQFRGAIKVSITASGTVDSVDILQPVHPEYDDLLRQAAMGWTYSPARINGDPVPSERVITIVLKPRE